MYKNPFVFIHSFIYLSHSHLPPSLLNAYYLVRYSSRNSIIQNAADRERN